MKIKNGNFNFNLFEKFNGCPGEGGVVMDMVKNLNRKMIIAFGVVALAVACLVPMVANAAGWPGVDEDDFTGTEAQTQVNLKTDESTLSFTAPTVINFTMDANGDFITPDAGVAHITNNSVMKIKVVSYAVESKSGATGVASVDGQTGADIYQVNIKGNTDSVLPFAINGTPGWVLGAKGAADAKCGLTFSDGKMVNPTASTWANGAELQEVRWTVSSNA